jgi:hypothetical protein
LKKLHDIIFSRDGFKCKRCGRKEDLVPHHILPRCYDGKSSLDNLVTLCRGCNSSIDAIIHSYYRNDFDGDKTKITYEFCLELLQGKAPKRRNAWANWIDSKLKVVN